MNYGNPIGYMKEIGKVHDIQCTEQLIGYSAAKFILNTHKLETNIGKVSNKPDIDGTFLRVAGALYDGVSTYADILVGTEFGINANNMFKQFNGKGVLELMRIFDEDSTLGAMDEITDEYTQIMKYRHIFAPILVGRDCMYRSKDGFTLDTKADTVRLEIDRETREVVYKIHLDNKANTFRNVTIPITEYGDTLFLSEVENINMNRALHVNRDLITFTNMGYVKPIQINCGKSYIVIDNSVAYKVLDDYIIPIAYWYKGKLVGEGLDELLSKSDMRGLKAFLNTNTNYIKQHKNYIAPAFVVEHNIVDINN